MNFPRYEFSDEIKPELASFFQASQSNHSTSSDNIWRNLLPQNLTLIGELQDIINESTKQVIIDLTDETVQKKDNETLPEESMVTNDENLNTTSIKDLVDSIKENLYTEDQLSEDILKDMLNVSSKEQDDMFKLFFDCLNFELISKLGNSIIKSSDTIDKSTHAVYYIRFLLLPKLFSEYNKQLETLFVNFLHAFLNITSEEFSKQISELTICPKYVDDILNSLEPKYKQKLLRDLVSNVTQLKQLHFPIIEALLPKDLNIETTQKLIELITAAATTFSTDKTFGKLLLNLLKCSRSHMHHFQEQLTTVVAVHQSVWRNKLQKQLADGVASHSLSMMSQSLRY